MKSIGLSVNQIEKDEGVTQNDCTIQLHLNLWKSPAGFHQPWHPFFLDVGIMAKFVTNRIYLYLPYEIRKEQRWSDLGRIMVENRPILCSLFNEDYNAIKVDNSCYYKVRPNCNAAGESQDSSALFYIYVLGETDIEIEEFDNKDTPGVIFKITVPNQEHIDSSQSYYIRFRIPITSHRQLALRSNLSNNPLQAAFTKLDMYNIQVNEQRDIPLDAIGLLKSDNFIFPPLKRIHFLYVASPKVNVTNGSSERFDSRIVDPSNWTAYIPDRSKSKSYLAYHWRLHKKEDKSAKDEKSGDGPQKENKGVEKILLFFKAKYPKTHPFSILAYCILVVLLGCAGSVIASLLCDSPNLIWEFPGKWWVIGLGAYFIIWWLLTHWREVWSFIRN